MPLRLIFWITLAYDQVVCQPAIYLTFKTKMESLFLVGVDKTSGTLLCNAIQQV